MCRDPILLIAQNFGTLFTCTTQTLYIGLKPNYSCDLFYIGSQAGIALATLAMFARIWRYCVQFHLVLLRNKYRENKNLEKGWEQQHWFFRNKWAGSSSFARKFFFFTWWIWFLPAVPKVLLHEGYVKYDICSTYYGSLYATVAVDSVFVIFAIIAAVLAWGARDTYHIKAEMKAWAIIWAVVYAIWLPYTSFSFPLQESIPDALWIVIGFYLTFCANTLWPLLLVYRATKMEVANTAEGYKAFIDDLEFLPFRNAFFDFMAKQFCQENLLFYEAVMDWKQLPTSRRCANALTIRETFIDDSGLCQVNIDANSRRSIEELVKPNTTELPDDTFDKALEEVLTNMYSNSYALFKRKATLLVQQSS